MVLDEYIGKLLETHRLEKSQVNIIFDNAQMSRENHLRAWRSFQHSNGSKERICRWSSNPSLTHHSSPAILKTDSQQPLVGSKNATWDVIENDKHQHQQQQQPQKQQPQGLNNSNKDKNPTLISSSRLQKRMNQQKRSTPSRTSSFNAPKLPERLISPRSSRSAQRTISVSSLRARTPPPIKKSNHRHRNNRRSKERPVSDNNILSLSIDLPLDTAMQHEQGSNLRRSSLGSHSSSVRDALGPMAPTISNNVSSSIGRKPRKASLDSYSNLKNTSSQSDLKSSGRNRSTQSKSNKTDKLDLLRTAKKEASTTETNNKRDSREWIEEAITTIASS